MFSSFAHHLSASVVVVLILFQDLTSKVEFETRVSNILWDFHCWVLPFVIISTSTQEEIISASFFQFFYLYENERQLGD